MSDRLAATEQILADLVAFDTTSHLSNLDLIAHVEALLAEHGLSGTRVTNADGDKASLFVRIGPADGAGFGLSGHTDVVPVEGQAWATDPFVLTPKGDKLYGRGAADMKGFLACVLAMVPTFVERDLARPIDLLFSYDEEVGCRGVRPLIAELGQSLPEPEIVIVGEPTSMRVVEAHKGAARFETVVTGHEAHSSLAHLGVNAIQFAAEFIAGLRQIERDLAELASRDRFAPAYSTLHVGLIEGGTAMNIVPKACRFGWEMRAVPGVATADLTERVGAMTREIAARMHTVDLATGIQTTATNDLPAFDAGDGSPATALALNLTGENTTDVVSYMTEASLFQAAGYDSVVCGPGDIAQAHAPDEFIARSQLQSCLDFLERLAVWARA